MNYFIKLPVKNFLYKNTYKYMYVSVYKRINKQNISIYVYIFFSFVKLLFNKYNNNI